MTHLSCVKSSIINIVHEIMACKQAPSKEWNKIGMQSEATKTGQTEENTEIWAGWGGPQTVFDLPIHNFDQLVTYQSMR